MLGKGLERALATRINHMAMERNWLGRMHAYGIIRRSTIDLIRCVVHEIDDDNGTKKGRYTAAVMFDVKGAFNAAIPKAVMKSLKELGVPTEVVRWTKAFMTNRTVYPRRGQKKGIPITLNSRLP